MSTLRTNTLQDASGGNSVPMATVASGTAKAWVNFNGTGVVSIGASFNVSSITDNGTGDYTVNFSSALATAFYAAGGVVSSDGNVPVLNFSGTGSTNATSSCRVVINNGVGGVLDRTVVSVVFFR
jgi:hypothetical protein